MRRSHAFIFSVRQGYEELERQLKEVFKERSNILRQLSKTSKELEGIKVNLQVRFSLGFYRITYLGFFVLISIYYKKCGGFFFFFKYVNNYGFDDLLLNIKQTFLWKM